MFSLTNNLRKYYVTKAETMGLVAYANVEECGRFFHYPPIKMVI